jgi:hypothetical protein
LRGGARPEGIASLACGPAPVAAKGRSAIRGQSHRRVNAVEQFAAFSIPDLCPRERIATRRWVHRKFAKTRAHRAKPLRHGRCKHACNLQQNLTYKILDDCHEISARFARLFIRLYFKLKHST